MVILYCVALANEEEEDVISLLCRGLCHALAQLTDPPILESCPISLFEKKQLFVPMLKKIAKESSCDYVPALCLGSMLEDERSEWLELLISRAFTTFASREEMKLCHPLLSHVTQQEWTDIAASTVVLKLRANPEKSLETTLALVEGLRDVELSEPQLLETLLKQLKSTKTIIRSLAQSIVVRMALLKPDSPTFVNIAEAVANVLTSSLTQADQRQAAYEVLRDMVSVGQPGVEAKVVSTVLTRICAALGKDAKTATLAREAGLEALLQWMVVAKRSNGGETGYADALEFLRKPLADGSGPDAQWRCGKFLTFVHPNVVESIVLDLWTVKLEKGLQLLVDASTKKHTASSTVPPVEGLVAVNLALLHAFASGSMNVTPGITKVLSAGSESDSKTSFLYCKSMTDAVVTNSVVGQLLPRTIALYTKLLAKMEEGSPKPLIGILSKQRVTSAAQALACCVAHPAATPDMAPSKAILSSVKTVLTYQPSAADALLEALLTHTNALTLANEEMKKSMNASREAREIFAPAEQPLRLNMKGQGSATAAHMGFDTYTVRRVASKLATSSTNPTSLATALVLMHVGSSHRRRVGTLRLALIARTLEIVNEQVLPWFDSGNEANVRSKFADFISAYACNYRPPETQDPADATESNKESDLIVSDGLHQSALSLVSSMGTIGSSFDPEINDPEDEDMKPYVFAQKLCTEDVASRFATVLKISLAKVEAFSEEDIDLYKSPMGLPFHGSNARDENGSESGHAEMVKSGSKSKRGKGGASFEDEEWERQMRKELVQKKSSEASGNSTVSRSTLSPKDKELAQRQDQERRRMALVLDGEFSRALSSIQSLCLSDIEVGNSSLPAVSEAVVESAISPCAAFQDLPSLVKQSLETLTVLAMCVYEIDEEFAPLMALALIVSCRRGETGPEGSKEGQSLVVSALPSPCEAAACTIFEMDELHDRLSGASFSFLFPVIRAALTGPRTCPGTEGALRVLDRHTSLLAGDEMDPVVASLRKDMVTTVLELLAHDRSQTFLDPAPYDAIVSCYYTDDDDESSSRPALSTAEIAPLLNERGALGGKNCRVGSMIALAAIASKHQKLCKNNPLIENRIWLNCFDDNELIRDAAVRSWRIVTGDEGGEEDLQAPSPMYGIPLLPLLHHADASVAKAAAQAYAHAMGKHPSSTERNMEKLCSNFIDNSPATSDDGKQKSAIPLPLNPKKVVAPLPKKKPISTGLPKKTTVKKTTAISIAGIGKPKTTKKKITNSALLKPKEERTLDRELLEGQFKTEKQASEPEKDSSDKIEVRHGVVRTIAACTDSSANVKLDLATLKLVTGFLVVYGLADGNDDVRGDARNALRDVVASNGDSEEAIAFLLPLFETVLSSGVADESCLGPLSTQNVLRNSAASDRRKDGVVVALGSIALHLKGAENESKIDSTIDMLISALKTPSEDVQSSIALCLAKLMKKGRTQERLEGILSNLMSECLDGDSPAVRRGAAYGISAVVKGSGIATLKKYEVVKKLEEACASGPSNAKEGALFSIELLSSRLGLLFEPYVIVLLPSLLKAFSDSSDYVRDAASKTADVIMSNLSAHGVKLVMPAVLTAFNDPSWRTKQASIHMLGSMSHCAPKQLASALPKVVPKVIEAFSDTHPKVKASAEEALNEISKVVKNPEVSSISPILLKALTDPAEYNIRGLEALIETEFLHAIDAPSLALIVPVLHRGLRDRGAGAKRYGALISGNICTMINDPRDFVPYVSILIPDLKIALMDPIPDVRSTSAKALGSLTRGLGESMLPDLRPWLIESLRDESRSSAERSGAAQGLTEVLIACGADVAENVMIDEIIPLRCHPQASTREGVLWVLTFLPPALGQSFTPLIDASLPALLGGLSDDSEPVRDVAMRAGRVLIRSHGKVHVDKILPSLEAGLTDEDYRIRVASLTLMGDLLSMIGGTTVLKGEGDTQDDIRKAERAQAQIALVLGAETRKRVLSGLYMARSDTAAVVRQSAIQVWKTVVSVTARTLRDILQVLVGQIVDALASGNPERTEVAGRCLGDIVHKLGDSVLPEIIPVLRSALYTGDRHTRRGVCVGLSEILNVSTKEQILRFIEIIVVVVRDALCDEDEGVREMAASCFQSLHKTVGNKALDEIVPQLLVGLENEDDKARVRALNGLTGILSIRSRELLPYIIPRLITMPISETHANALGSIAAVTGATIHMHFSSIVPNIITELASFHGKDLDEEEKKRMDAIRMCARSISHNVDEGGVNWLVSEIASKCGNDKEEIRVESCWMFHSFIEESKSQRFEPALKVLSWVMINLHFPIGSRLLMRRVRVFYYEISV
jgi:HEAT repeat protein